MRFAKHLLPMMALSACMAPPTVPELLDGRTAIVGDVPLPALTKASFIDFQTDNEAYGAMYVTTDGEGYAWTTGAFTLADAETEARVTCEATNDERCVPYATITPPAGTPEGALPSWMVDDVAEIVKRTRPGRFAAIAVMPTGAFGHGSDYATEQEAVDRAMRECRALVAEEKSSFERPIRLALDAEGLFDCRLFQVYSN